jgi:hypothetical protein
MADNINDFWYILDEIQGESTDLTDSLKAIAKNEKTVSENLFSNIIDQIAYNSQDYQRLRSFLRDWYAAHRTVTAYQSNISDVYQMPNDQLDDLFQSFGYNLSTTLKNPINNNAPLNKVNFFLDLVNLYKRKGSPSALLSVLQYYGLTNVDIYEMSLQFDDRDDQDSSDLIFKGKVVSGTSGDTSPLYLNFDLLTENDPHWFQSEEKIRQLFLNNKINFPSQSPYFAVKPIFDEEATDGVTGILQRQIQDQHDTWETAGFPAEDTTPVLDQNAIISITGDQCSLLTLYLSCIYIFQKEYEVGIPYTPEMCCDGTDTIRFVCYDGTNTAAVDILEEFRDITGRIDTRAEQKANWELYLETFTRNMCTNFLIYNDAKDILATLNPTVKANLDGLLTNNNTILGSLLSDLGEWIRANISYGFINVSYILFGIDSLFGNLRNVIEFFKPYRARIVPLEMMQFSNRLFNSVIVEDEIAYDISLDVHDYLVGDSTACCSDSTCIALYGPREYYDCGSNHDIGAVVDEFDYYIVQHVNDYFNCRRVPPDTTGYEAGYVISEISNYSAGLQNAETLTVDSTSITVVFDEAQPNDGYSIILNMFNEDVVLPSIYAYTVIDKTINGFTVEFSSPIDSNGYYMTWDIRDDSLSGIQPIANSSNQVSVSFATDMTNADYSIMAVIENTVDPTSSQFLYTIVEKSVSGFTLELSSATTSGNYSLDWVVSEYGREAEGTTPITGWINIPNGSNSITIPLFPAEIFDNYNVSFTIINTDDTSVSKFSHIVTSKDVNGFSILLSGFTDSPNYYVSWNIPISSNTVFNDFLYTQSGQMRDFDEYGNFDCTHGMDECQIEIETEISYILQENGDYLLQEDGSRLIY